MISVNLIRIDFIYDNLHFPIFKGYCNFFQNQTVVGSYRSRILKSAVDFSFQVNTMRAHKHEAHICLAILLASKLPLLSAKGLVSWLG